MSDSSSVVVVAYGICFAGGRDIVERDGRGGRELDCAGIVTAKGRPAQVGCPDVTGELGKIQVYMRAERALHALVVCSVGGKEGHLNSRTLDHPSSRCTV